MASVYAGSWGPQPLFDTHGTVIIGAQVYVYVDSGRTSLANLYTDHTKQATQANPITSDSLGNYTVWTDPGVYYITIVWGQESADTSITIQPYPGTAATSNPVVQLTDASTIAIDASTGVNFTVTLGGNRALGTPSNPADGEPMLIQVVQDATGSRTLTFSSAYEFASSLGSPVLSSAPGTTDLLAFIYSAAKTKWLFVAFVAGFS